METLNLCDIYNACGINRLYPQNRANCSCCISRLRRSVQKNTFCRLHGTPPSKQCLLYPNAQQRSCPGSAKEILCFHERVITTLVFVFTIGCVLMFLCSIEGTRHIETTMAFISNCQHEWLVQGMVDGGMWSVVSLYPPQVAIDTCQ